MPSEHDLLRWAIQNTPAQSSDPSSSFSTQPTLSSIPPEQRAGLLKKIMGESDAEKMLRTVKGLEESLKEGESWEASDREVGWDNLEMLLEDLNNSNDLQNLSLWPTILSFLTLPTDDRDKAHACWVIGTAVQNEEKSRNDFLNLKPAPLALLSGLLLSTSSPTTRAKVIYALTSSLKHSGDAVVEAWLNAEGDGVVSGKAVLTGGLSDPSPIVRQKTAWLLNLLFLQSGTPKKLLDILRSSPSSSSSSSSPLEILLRSLSPSTSLPLGPDGDVDSGDDEEYREKAWRVVMTMLERISISSDPLPNIRTLSAPLPLGLPAPASSSTGLTAGGGGNTEAPSNPNILLAPSRSVNTGGLLPVSVPSSTPATTNEVANEGRKGLTEDEENLIRKGFEEIQAKGVNADTLGLDKEEWDKLAKL